jgi:hypothetical protein
MIHEHVLLRNKVGYTNYMESPWYRVSIKVIAVNEEGKFLLLKKIMACGKCLAEAWTGEKNQPKA